MIDVVAAVIVRNGRLLLTQRAPEQDHPWLWHCPAGKCHGDRYSSTEEGWEDAAIRETREELGLDGEVRVLRTEHGTVAPIAGLVFKGRNIAWYAVDIGDQKPLPIEGVGVGWFSPYDLEKHAGLTVPTETVLDRLIAHVRRRA